MGRRQQKCKNSGNFVACLVVSPLVGSWLKVMESYRTMRPWRIGWTQMWYLEVVEEINRREMIRLGCTCWIATKKLRWSGSDVRWKSPQLCSVDVHWIEAGLEELQIFSETWPCPVIFRVRFSQMFLGKFHHKPTARPGNGICPGFCERSVPKNARQKPEV